MKGYVLALLVHVLALQALAGPLENALTPAERLVQVKHDAEAGDPGAQTKLADHYNGSFMHAAAKRWYEAAAAQGYPPALASLGDLYATTGGFGTNQIVANHTNAFNLHRLAAAQGYESSHYKVGIAYREGRIVPRNLVLAYKHLKLSRSLISNEYLKQVILEMSEQQIKEAETEVAQFRAVPFQQAFQNLVFDSVRLAGIFSDGSNRMAILNGNPTSPGGKLSINVAGLPAILKCESIQNDAVVLSLGAVQKRLAVAKKPRDRS